MTDAQATRAIRDDAPAASLIARLGLTEERVATDPKDAAVRAIRLARDAARRAAVGEAVRTRAPAGLLRRGALDAGPQNRTKRGRPRARRTPIAMSERAPTIGPA